MFESKREPKEVSFKFHPQMELAILEGRKCCTTRVGEKEPRAHTKDWFYTEGERFNIVGVLRRVVYDVYVSHVTMEGFEGKTEMEKFFAEELGMPMDTWGQKCNVYFFARGGK